MNEQEFSHLSAVLESGSLPIDFPEDLRQLMTWRGILVSLRLDGSTKAIELLKETGRVAKKPENGLLAVRFLGELALEGKTEAASALMDLAIEHQNAASVDFLKSHSELRKDIPKNILFLLLYAETQEYLAADPRQKAISELIFTLPTDLQERVLACAAARGLKNWTILIQGLLQPETLPKFIDAFPRLQGYEQALFFELVEKSIEVSRQLQSAVCQLFTLYENAQARSLALERSFAPDNSVQAALFYFLAEEWKRYEEIDFSHKLLTTGYEMAGQAVRRKILALSRSAGQVEWMKALSAGSQTRWLSEMSDPEWEATIQSLLSAQRWNDLWLLAQAATPLWSGKILLALEGAGWMPTGDEEQKRFARLAELAQECRHTPYAILPRAVWHSPAREVTAIAIDQNEAALAAGNSQTAILRWQLSENQNPLTTLFSPVAGSNAMSFSPDVNYLAIASSDHKIRIFDLKKGTIVKSIEGHNGLVRALQFQPDGRYLYSASFDGTVQSWRFPNGVRHALIPASKQELFGLAVSRDGKFLLSAGAEKKILVYGLPETDLIRSLEGHQDTITLLSASPTGTQAASFSRDLALKFWNFASGKEINSIRPEEPLTSLAFHPTGRYILGGSKSGKIQIWSFPSGQALNTLSTEGMALVGLGFIVAGDELISANADGLFCRWDLSLFTLSRTPVESLLESNARILSQLRTETETKNGLAWWKFMDELIRWRKRFDIEVSEAHPVLHVDEYDIEL